MCIHKKISCWFCPVSGLILISYNINLRILPASGGGDWQLLRNSTKGRVGGTKNQSFLASAESKVASMSYGHGNMVFLPPASRLSSLCRLQPFTVITFRWMWVHWSTSFVLLICLSYLLAAEGFLLKSCAFYFPVIRTLLSWLLRSPFTSPRNLFVNLILPVTLGTFWQDLPLPISSNYAPHRCSFRLPANHTRALCLLLLVLSAPSRELHVMEYSFFVNFSCFHFASRLYMTPANARAGVLVGVHAHLHSLSVYFLTCAARITMVRLHWKSTSCWQ